MVTIKYTDLFLINSDFTSAVLYDVFSTFKKPSHVPVVVYVNPRALPYAISVVKSRSSLAAALLTPTRYISNIQVHPKESLGDDAWEIVLGGITITCDGA